MRSASVILLLTLSLVPAPLAAQEGFSLFTTDFAPEEFAARRAKVFAAIGNDGLAILQGAASPAGYTRFRQNNDFYYLCGIESPHAYLLLDGNEKLAAVYLPHRNESRERSEGKVLSAEDSDEVKKLAKLDGVFPLERLGEHLARYARLKQRRVLWAPLSPGEGIAMSRDLALRRVADAAADPWGVSGSREGEFINRLRLSFPQLEIRDLSPTLDALRLIKSEREIELIRRATRLSGLGLIEAMRSTVPGIRESDLDAVAKYIFHRNGAQADAYYSLIGAGRNAWFPHYNAGKKTLQDGELLLMDYAPDVGYYSADVTRMWPVNGKFNQGQRELYGFYLDCYRAILKNIRPGLTPATIIERAGAEMTAVLERSRFSKPIYEKAARAFVENYAKEAKYPDASLGHWTGMAVHDVGFDFGPLRAGMVFTIEPALRVPEEQIYIRLEDMIIIHGDRVEIASDFVPMDMEAIEKLMREEGMLQRYPADRSR